MILALAAVLLFCATACGDVDPSRTVLDAAAIRDAGEPDAPEADATFRPTCDSVCQAFTLEAQMGGATAGFARAYYGLTTPANATSGDWEIHVEAFSGGTAGCPAEDSPAPDRTLTLGGMPMPVSGTTVSQEDGGSITLFDFEGSLLPLAPLSRASTWTLTVSHTNICKDCVGSRAPSHADGELAFDLESIFPEGTVSGHIYATHCDSLDAF